jgi:hypothetical protein
MIKGQPDAERQKAALVRREQEALNMAKVAQVFVRPHTDALARLATDKSRTVSERDTAAAAYVLAFPGAAS